MNILVTGGAGYIGSHTCVELLKHNHTVIVADNLCNSSYDAIENIEFLTNQKVTFYQIDVTDKQAVDQLFNKHQLDGVIHFAGFKAVGESVSVPLDYYQNNLLSTIVLVKACLEHGVNRFVFSSSATVYGDQMSPLKEDMELKPTTNPYGETKAMSERILTDVAKANPTFAVSLLRYFNPVGAHPSGKLGEKPVGIPNNLMPYVTQVAKGQLKELNVYGNDYPTYDGTGVRDYIHVVDLAIGHVYAIEKINPGVVIYNLGTGQGTSVLGVINTFKQVNQIEIPYKIVDRRPGDVAICFADASKAYEKLGWKTTKTIEDMVKDAWNYEKNN
jgi:UDP-glucose 4-epimerase